MGGTQAARVLTQIQVSSLKKQGKAPDPEGEQALFEQIKEKYDSQTTPYYAAARLWVDAIIDPRATREFISLGIEMADHGIVEKFNPGVLQT
jgi:acetyl-CoA carboxylase carboxyltransferase component